MKLVRDPITAAEVVLARGTLATPDIVRALVEYAKSLENERDALAVKLAGIRDEQQAGKR